MIPVDQTLFGPVEGNCHAACVASILELPLWRVPNVACHSDWYRRLTFWLNRHGFGHITFSGNVGDDAVLREMYANHYLIAGGPAARGLNHSVVYRGFEELVHDPHPSRAGLERVEDFTWLTITDVSKARALIARAEVA